MSVKQLVKIIDDALKRKGVSARKASIDAVKSEHLIKNIKDGREPSFYKVEKLFQHLGINLTYSLDDEPITAPAKVPMLGLISAGGDDLPDDTSVTYIPTDDNGDTTSTPPGTYLQMQGNLFALTVKGSSMLPVYSDGDILFMYKDDPARANLERLIGINCAVTLIDGEAFVKRLARPDSGKLGEWNLESLNPRWPVMRNVQLTDALPVRHVTHKV